MITLQDICLSFGTQQIFDNLSYTIVRDHRIGLIGRNGSGKSTLLSILAKQKKPDAGIVTIAKGHTVAYLPQQVTLDSDQTILQETFNSFSKIKRLIIKKLQLEKTLHNFPDTPNASEEYGDLCELLAELNPDAAQAETKKILMGLGFTIKQFDMPVSSLSVGWKMRIVLAKLLLKKADFYLFDEPTNHLDIIAQEWFLQFLKQAQFGFMLVSHEQYLLNQLCTHILELEQSRNTMYTGNYNHYEKQKEHDRGLLESAYTRQQKTIKRKMETVNRFRSKSSKAKMAQSMLKSIEKIDRITLPFSLKEVSFTFPAITQSGKVVLTVKNLSHQFDSKILFKETSFEIMRGQKVAIVAPNGAGKTTLLNLIAGTLQKQAGTISFGHNVDYTLFDQDQAAALSPELTILENIQKNNPEVSEHKIRSLLGTLLFSRDAIYKPVSVLSGGEKNRVGMASVLLHSANFLLLDEPTNHLDIPSKQVLLKVLQGYTGTILFVSHDRNFVTKLATDIIELDNGVTTFYQNSNWETYLFQKQFNKKVIEENGKNFTTQTHKENHTRKIVQSDTANHLHKKNKSLEKIIATLEHEIKQIEHLFNTITYGSEQFLKQQQLLKKMNTTLSNHLSKWEKTQKKLEIHNKQ